MTRSRSLVGSWGLASLALWKSTDLIARKRAALLCAPSYWTSRDPPTS
jgi:hypothetical protein